MANNIIGVKNNNTIVPYQAATKRTKALNVAAYITAGVNASSLTVTSALAFFYADSSGKWFMDLQANYSATLATDKYHIVDITGVTFDATASNYQGFAATVDDSNYLSVGHTHGYVSPDSASLIIGYGASVTGETGKRVYVSLQQIKLKQEPIWASLGTTAAAALEGVTAVDVYIAPASASVDGIVNRSAQTFAGVKTFNDGVVLGAGNTALKCKVLTGTTAAAEGGTTAVAHGLTGNNILGWTVKVISTTDWGIAPITVHSNEYQYQVIHDATNFSLYLSDTNSGNILSKTFYIMVWYV